MRKGRVLMMKDVPSPTKRLLREPTSIREKLVVLLSQEFQPKEFVRCAMTFVTPDHSILWDRTLPKPTALLHNGSHIPFGGNRSSSLLQHHIVTDKFSREFLDTGGRRKTVPCVAYEQRPQSFQGAEPVPDQPPAITGNVVNPNHLKRERRTSHMAEGNESRESSPSSPNTSDAASQFCLCQPEAKIPRPRNAFILYRQHRQASVVAKHPGLPNPDISKIIGEQWRSLPANTKNEWKTLAEEEKARHQQQYPYYRYQPRRNGRCSGQVSISGPSSGGTVDPQGNCIKCGRKMMIPPSTSYPPFTPVTPVVPQMAILPRQQRIQYAVAAPQTGRPQAQQTLMSPQSARIRPYAEVFCHQAPVDPRFRYSNSQTAPNAIVLDSPDAKRRRFNSNGVFVPAPGQVYSDQGYQHSPRTTPFSRPEATQPRTTMALPSRSMHTQAPPPQLHPVNSPTGHTRHDHNLTLPPLKTLTSQPAKGQSQKSGIEAMIMSIPVLKKIKILGQISHHLAAPGIVTPPHDIRGAIIAVEGMDEKSLFSMTTSLAEHLEKDGIFAVRIFGGPGPYVEGADKMTTETFLKTISEWHKISREMVQYITTKSGSHFDVEMESRKLPMQHAVLESAMDRRMSVQQLTSYGDVSRDLKSHREGDTQPASATDLGSEDTSVETGKYVVDRRMSVKEVIAETDASDDLQSYSGPNAQNPNAMEVDAPTDIEQGSTVTQADPMSAVSPKTTDQITCLSLTSPRMNGHRTSSTDSIDPNTPRAPSYRRPSASTTLTTPISCQPKSPFSLPLVPENSARKTYLAPPRAAIPIAIVPHYQLTTVDSSSIAMPITDSYSPLNHWTWLASLWRGCVGPDVTVVIRGAEPEADSQHRNINSNNNITEEVECRLLDCRSIVVNTSIEDRAEAGVEGGENSVAWEKSKRRVGFEVEEFLRK